ncbi:hypothetical protein BOTBODRAFT_135510 [Botryobasidium botryosum FD-172 SS1]|uniref:Transcription factor spt8 beta-propeller domain-containing protein n=1 Tax=Botryobasidium botryosum (strain FD-172 SS1) TaxID=930990 RepID=A0A067M802_BOTB1|nr:hypothetical protein BOTBODRAFT_135510 [Botryobasidium botryosum FD-172 SS1]
MAHPSSDAEEAGGLSDEDGQFDEYDVVEEEAEEEEEDDEEEEEEEEEAEAEEDIFGEELEEGEEEEAEAEAGAEVEAEAEPEAEAESDEAPGEESDTEASSEDGSASGGSAEDGRRGTRSGGTGKLRTKDDRAPARDQAEVEDTSYLLSPTYKRRSLFHTSFDNVRSYTIDPICAIPHPAATHSLAASLCMTHLLTGSDDGFIRDYDFFAGCNGKSLLTAPQRHHCGLGDGVMKGGVLNCWWENVDVIPEGTEPEIRPVSPVYSMVLQADALWGISGTKTGHLNLFTVRHDPGRIHHVLPGHRGPISGLALQGDEKAVFSAGWDGEAQQWDLNTGQSVRKFPYQGSQLTAIAVRPITSEHGSSQWQDSSRISVSVRPEAAARSVDTSTTDTLSDQAANLALGLGLDAQPGISYMSGTTLSDGMASFPPTQMSSVEPTNIELPSTEVEMDATGESDDGYDPLFDDDADGEGDMDTSQPPAQPAPAPPAPPPPASAPAPAPVPLAVPNAINNQNYSFSFTAPFGQQDQFSNGNGNGSGAQPQSLSVPQSSRYELPLLDPVTYASYSRDILLTACIDGQVVLWDRRAPAVSQGRPGVGRLELGERCPPWCVSACWSSNGAQVYAGRRNGTIDVWDTRKMGTGYLGTPTLLRSLRNPPSSGAVSCVASFPDGHHLACASQDNIRLWDINDAGPETGRSRAVVPFKIIAGHHGGIISQMLIDATSKFMITASGNRGWFGETTRTILVHEIRPS